jgi:hypothetical protein
MVGWTFMLVRTHILCYGLIIDQEQMMRPVQTQACTLDWKNIRADDVQYADAWTSPVAPPACWLLVVTVTYLQSDLILDSTLSWSTTLFVCLRYVLYY